jgi:hypothetical protein
MTDLRAARRNHARHDLRLGLLLGLGLGAFGCSYTLDDGGPELQLVGTAIEPSAFAKLNPDGVPINDVYVRRGTDGAPWAVLVTAPIVALPPPPIVDKQPTVVYLVPLSATAPTQTIRADQIMVSNRLLYLISIPTTDGAPLKLVLRQPGDDGVGRTLMMPPGGASIVPSPHDEAFIYLTNSDQTHSLLLLRSDGSFQRELPLPDGVDGTMVLSNVWLLFDDNGDHLITQTPDGTLISHSTTDETDVMLGTADHQLLVLGQGPAVIDCGPSGLVRIPIDGSPRLVLDATACQPDLLWLAQQKVFYKREDALYSVAELGGTPTKVADPPIEQLFGIGPDGAVLYSKDPALLYGDGIGDGWIGGTQYLSRGRRPAWSADGSRLRWLESAARSDGSGELVSAILPSPQTTLLAHNVRQFQEVAPGRTLAISNASGRGVYNRLILIDENQQQAHWVVDSARAFAAIPGSTDVLASIVNGQIGYDVRRVQVPQLGASD